MPKPTPCHRPLAHRAAARTALLAAVLALPLTAAADSSLTARLLAPVAGPGLEQTAELVLDFFPGDGEAILQAALAVPTDQVRILRAAAVRGATRLEAGRVLLDYAARPIGAHAVDTVAVTIQALRVGSVPWTLTLATNVDSGPTPRRFETSLRVEPPAVVTAGLDPARVYPGEVTRIAVTVVGRDAAGQPLAGIDVAWPEGLQPTATAQSIARGDTLRLEWPVSVSRTARAPIDLAVAARAGALRASPVHVPPLRVAQVPVFAAGFAATALVGQEATLHLRWDNPGTEGIAFEALTAEVSAGCALASLADEPAGARLEADEEKGSLRVQVAGPGQIAPGQTVAVDIRLTPIGSGPFSWSAGYQPPDRPSPVPLRGAVVTAMAPAPTAGPLGAGSLATDLELASSGMRRALAAALEALPAPPGTAVAIVADHRDDGNWVVEGLLTELLLVRGLRVLDEPGDDGHVLHYRLADAEVVYSPLRGGLNPFAASRRRDARAEVFLRLEDPGTRIAWTRRVSSRAGDTANAAAAQWLGGAKGIAQAHVDPDHRAVEFGLSGLIVGGLFFVFFAP